jgi:type IV pilus assembly protein PilA
MSDQPHIPHIPDQDGFTLIELLVVILIIGILSAIAIPAFLSQKTKANDAGAKSQIGTLQTAMETYSTEHDGIYEGATLPLLEAIEPTLKNHIEATPVVVNAGKEEYEVESIATSGGDKFKYLTKRTEVARKCEPAGHGGCTAGGTW